MMTEEELGSVIAYECVLREINHRLNVLDTSPTGRVEYMTGKRLALEGLQATVSSWVRRIEEKEPKRITMDLVFIPVGERLPVVGDRVFVIQRGNTVGPGPQRAYRTEMEQGDSVPWLYWWRDNDFYDAPHERLYDVTHWAEIPKVGK